MRYGLMLWASMWAALAVMRLRFSPLVQVYFLLQVFSVIWDESILLFLIPRSAYYTYAYLVPMVPLLYLSLRIAIRSLESVSRGLRLATLAEASLLAAVACCAALHGIRLDYGYVPTAFVVRMADGAILTLAGIVASVGTPTLEEPEGNLIRTLGILWVAQAAWEFCFIFSVADHYETWIMLNRWLPASLVTVALCWIGFSLPKPQEGIVKT